MAQRHAGLDDEPVLLDRLAVAKLLYVKPRSIKEYVKRGVLHPLRVPGGRKVLFPPGRAGRPRTRSAATAPLRRQQRTMAGHEERIDRHLRTGGIRSPQNRSATGYPAKIPSRRRV